MANAEKVKEARERLAKNKANAPEEKHDHPAENGNVRVEQVFMESGVTAGDEGCAEHYYQRFVQMEEAGETQDFSLLRDAMLGAVILTPRFKSPWKRRFP